MKSGSEPIFAAGWMALGAAVLAASWRMDRLANLNINPWSAPGLLPGVLGALMLVFGGALLLRSLAAREGGERAATGSAARTWLALALCFGYAAGLLGRGLPFWLTSAAFLFAAILAFRWLDRDAGARQAQTLPRLARGAALVALAASAAIGLLFQEVFLLNLP